MTKTFSVTGSQRRALAVALIIALVFGAYFLRAYVTLILFAAIMAFVFNPIYHWFQKRTSQDGSAAGLTFIAALFLILIPLGLIMIATSLQITNTVKSIDIDQLSADPSRLIQDGIDTVNRLFESTPLTFRLTPSSVTSYAITAIQQLGSVSFGYLEQALGGFIGFFTTAIIFIYVFLSLLKNQKTIIGSVHSLNPLGPEISDLYLRRISAMTKAMVRGQFVIAVAQGFVDAALIYIGGIHTAFFFIFMILTVLSFIPLGGGIVAIPVGLVMILTGNWIGGIIVIAGHILIVTNIDNLLRPRLVPSEAKLDAALTILSVFAGLALLGFLGIIVGPVIMIVIVTTITVYLDVKANSKPL